LPLTNNEANLVCRRSAIRIIWVIITARLAGRALPWRAFVAAEKRRNSVHSIAEKAEETRAGRRSAAGEHIADQTG